MTFALEGGTDTPVVLLELGGIIVATAIVGRLATRAGIPSIPLFLLVGIAIGDGGLVPVVTAGDFIETGAQIGVVLLLLLLGLEYTGAELVTSLRTTAGIGVIDAVLNFTPGFLAGIVLGWNPLAAAFLGGITYISSSGIVAKLLPDLGWLGNREVPTVLSVLVLEDLAMAIYLPIVAALLAGGSLVGTSLTIVGALASVTVILFAAVRYGNTLSRVAFGSADNSEAILLGVLGIALLVAGFAERFRISGAVAAFLVGIAISGRTAQEASVLLGPVRDVFAAVFFVFFGLQVDPAAIPSVLAVAVPLAVLTAVTKMMTGWFGARRRQIGVVGRWRAAAVLVARGEFSIIIAQLAVAGSLNDTLPALATTYVLLTAIAGPIIARVIVPAVNLLRPAPPQPAAPS